MSLDISVFQYRLIREVRAALSELSDSTLYRDLSKFVTTLLGRLRSLHSFRSILQFSKPHLLGAVCVVGAICLIRPFFRRMMTTRTILVLWDWENMGWNNEKCHRFGDGWDRAIEAFVRERFGDGRNSSPMKVRTQVYRSTSHPLSHAQEKMHKRNGFHTTTLEYRRGRQVVDIEMISDLRNIDPAIRSALTLVVITSDRMLLDQTARTGVRQFVGVVQNPALFAHLRDATPPPTVIDSEYFYSRLIELRR